MRRNITGQTLARIALEVCEEEDMKLLVDSKTLDLNQTAEGEAPVIFWAPNNEKLEIVKILLECPDLDLKMMICQLEIIAR